MGFNLLSVEEYSYIDVKREIGASKKRFVLEIQFEKSLYSINISVFIDYSFFQYYLLCPQHVPGNILGIR